MDDELEGRAGEDQLSGGREEAAERSEVEGEGRGRWRFEGARREGVRDMG